MVHCGGEFHDFTGSGRRSFRGWPVGGTQERVCDSTRAWHKSCFARITLNSGTSATFRYSQLAWPAATAQLYHEFKVRCPTYSNSTDCVITAEVKGLDANGNPIHAYTNANITI